MASEYVQRTMYHRPQIPPLRELRNCRRKVQLVGNASMTIALPALWCRANNIQKGDTLTLVLAQNGDLIIQAAKNPQ
jgi:hypothetical protein